MSDIAAPSHGKYGAIYRLRPNNFVGSGLNDATFGTAFDLLAAGMFEVQIDGVSATNTFKWRKNGGSWTTGVAMTGAAQTLSNGQTVTFAATTGHTVGGQWTIGHLVAEACTPSGKSAQITDITKRTLNPSALPAFTDSGGALVQWIDTSSGTAWFDKNVSTVTVTGKNGYLPAAALQKMGYLIDWAANVKVDVPETSAMGDNWKSFLAGMGGGDGTANAYYIGNATLFEELQAAVNATEKQCFLQLFTYDPDQDGTGSHLNVWVLFNAWGVKAAINEVVKENIGFSFEGKPGYVANT